jgi:predicted TPR repeat methyltransferase
MINALLFERPIWFTTGPLEVEEAAQEMEDFNYHRPVLVNESVEMLAPRAGSVVVDGTCGGGGHTAEILRSGADAVSA